MLSVLVKSTLKRIFMQLPAHDICCYYNFFNILLTGVGAFSLMRMVVVFLAWIFTNCLYGVSHLLGETNRFDLMCFKVRILIKKPCAVLFLTLLLCFVCVPIWSLLLHVFLVLHIWTPCFFLLQFLSVLVSEPEYHVFVMYFISFIKFFFCSCHLSYLCLFWGVIYSFSFPSHLWKSTVEAWG